MKKKKKEKLKNFSVKKDNGKVKKTDRKKEEREKIKVKKEELKEYSNDLGIVGIHAFTLQTINNNTAHCRNFAPYVGIDEEAATGTASGALGVYLINEEIKKLNDNNEANFIFEQGYFMNRKSEIACDIKKEDNSYNVVVGGKATICIKGDIYI